MRIYRWCPALLLLGFFVKATCLFSQPISYEEVVEVLRDQTLQEASWALTQAPITVTSEISDRSAGNKHCFFSEGDYWWPDSANPDGPYIQRDGMTNPNNFVSHRKAMIRFSRIVGALVSAFQITQDKKYAHAVIPHLKAWFVDAETFMEPHLKYAQAIKGKVTGRGIGIIDTIHLMEVSQSILILFEHKVIDKTLQQQLNTWFRQYLDWLMTSSYGIEEMNAKNNHGTCWVMQVASFAKLLKDTTTLQFCSERYKNVLLPEQMANDGSFPLELKRTKPYGYSIFNLDAMATICQILSEEQDLWLHTVSEQRSMKKGITYLFPYITDKTQWPFAKDVMYWDQWPVAQPSILFASLRFNNREWFEVWRAGDHSPTEEEVIRNLPIRHPLLWIKKF